MRAPFNSCAASIFMNEAWRLQKQPSSWQEASSHLQSCLFSRQWTLTSWESSSAGVTLLSQRSVIGGRPWAHTSGGHCSSADSERVLSVHLNLGCSDCSWGLFLQQRPLYSPLLKGFCLFYPKCCSTMLYCWGVQTSNTSPSTVQESEGEFSVAPVLTRHFYELHLDACRYYFPQVVPCGFCNTANIVRHHSTFYKPVLLYMSLLWL